MKFKEDKTSLIYRLRQQIYQAAVAVVGKRKVKREEVVLEHPLRQAQGKLDFGDYSVNLALILFGRLKKKPENPANPFDLANTLVNTWRSAGLPEEVAKIEVAPPGFINLWLQNSHLISQLQQVLDKKDRYGRADGLTGKKILLEHTSPNPQTTITLGHLRNNFLGMSVSRILEFSGAKVTKDCIVNDRGIHLCRAIWGYLVFGRRGSGLKKKELLNFREVTDQQLKKLTKKTNWEEFLAAWVKKKSAWWQPAELRLKPDHANLIWYVLGSRAYELSEKVKKQVEEILIAWEAKNKDVRKAWGQILDWSAKGYAETYQRIGSLHDWVWHESNHWQKGKDIVKEGLKKKVFRRSEGAIVTNLSKYGLSDTVVVKTDGTALYLTQDLALTKLKCQKFPGDLYIWDIGAEQTLYFKQMFAVCEELGIGRQDKFFHLSYALINFKGGGKMATRKGDVVMADEIIDELQGRALKIIKASNQELRGKLNQKQLESLAEKVAVGAVKYSLLKFSRDTTIYFDIDESLALEGNSGPYLQYTHARCRSVLRRAKIFNSQFPISNLNWKDEELAILRTIYQFPEVVLAAGQNYAPNLICNFLFDLASKFNLFYNKHSILKAGDPELVKRRLALTVAVGQILKNGLGLLGIETPERM